MCQGNSFWARANHCLSVRSILQEGPWWWAQPSGVCAFFSRRFHGLVSVVLIAGVGSPETVSNSSSRPKQSLPLLFATTSLRKVMKRRNVSPFLRVRYTTPRGIGPDETQPAVTSSPARGLSGSSSFTTEVGCTERHSCVEAHVSWRFEQGVGGYTVRRHQATGIVGVA